MKRNSNRSICAVMALAGTVGASPIVDPDFIVLGQGPDPVFGDGSDSGVLGSPPWHVVSGSLGAEFGTRLTMHAGDMIAPLDHAIESILFASMDLTGFSSHASASLVLLGDKPDEASALSFDPLAAPLIENGFGPLGIGPVFTFENTKFEATLKALGDGNAKVNGFPVLDEALVFVPVAGIAFAIIPEPSTLVLLGLGLVAMVRRKRAGRLTPV